MPLPSPQRSSTYFLRFVMVLLGAIVLALCIWALPALWRGGSAEYPLVALSVQLIVLGLYATAVPYYLALGQGWRLLGLIDRGSAFSAQSVRALQIIKYCAALITVLYFAGVPLLYPLAESEDAPGLLLMGLGLACAPAAVAVCTAILQRLLQDALDLQSENNLTI